MASRRPREADLALSRAPTGSPEFLVRAKGRKSGAQPLLGATRLLPSAGSTHLLARAAPSGPSTNQRHGFPPATSAGQWSPLCVVRGDTCQRRSLALSGGH